MNIFNRIIIKAIIGTTFQDVDILTHWFIRIRVSNIKTFLEKRELYRIYMFHQPTNVWRCNNFCRDWKCYILSSVDRTSCFLYYDDRITTFLISELKVDYFYSANINELRDSSIHHVAFYNQLFQFSVHSDTSEGIPALISVFSLAFLLAPLQWGYTQVSNVIF